MKELCFCIYLKILRQFKGTCVSELLLVVAFENTPANKSTFKVDDKKYTRTATVNVIQVPL